jgi:hypothetical protein
MIKGDYYTNHYNEFISTKATQEHWWNKLWEHITFCSYKNFFFVAGEGLSNAETSTVLSKQVTHLGQTSTLQELLTSKKIFAFIHNSQSGGCKIICQHNDPTIIRSKGKSEAQPQPCVWFTTHIIGAEKDLTEQLDWTTKKFKPRWSYTLGTAKGTTTSQQSSTDNIGKHWTTNWHMQKDKKLAVSKLSSSGNSIETICSQLMLQQQQNKKLIDLTEKLKEDSKKESELHHQQMTKRNQKWKEHMDSKTTTFAARVEHERKTLEATTNQKIKSYEAMNDQLQFKNKAIKACCNSQAVQQTVMQQQIAELLACQNIRQNQFSPDHLMDYNHKRNTPATPTTMSNSPGQASKKVTTDIAPKNLLETLTKSQNHQTQHRSPARSRSLTAINTTAQGISRQSPGHKSATPTTTYAKESTGGSKK